MATIKLRGVEGYTATANAELLIKNALAFCMTPAGFSQFQGWCVALAEADLGPGMGPTPEFATWLRKLRPDHLANLSALMEVSDD